MRRSGTPLLWAGLVVASGIALAALAAQQLQVRQRAATAARFDDLTQRAANQIASRFGTYEYGLRGMRGMIISLGPDGITRRKVIAYSRSRELEREFPGARGYGFIRRVPRREEAEFLERARRDDRPGFTISELAPHPHERLVIQYIEPEADNRQAVGFDIASEDTRRDAALEAMRTGRATLTHPVTLVQASGMVKRGFLLMMPAYRDSADLSTPRAREQAAYGLAYAPLIIDEILADFDFHGGEFSLALDDLDSAGKRQRFYDSDDQGGVAGLVERRHLALFGRDWLVEIRALPLFMERLNQTPPRQLALLITVGALLLGGLVYGDLLARARKRQALQQQARLAAIVAGSNDAIIGLSLDALVTDWNPAAESIFGYAARAAIGRRVVDLIVPQGLEDEERLFLQRVVAGEAVTHFVTRRQRADGSQLYVSVTVSPIRDAHGQVAGVAKTVRDISAQREAEERIRELNTELERKVEERTMHLETAVRELVDFSYLVSHDLRTPLRAIDGFSSLLLRQSDALADEARDYLRRIRVAAQHMGRIIDDMVALSQIARRSSSADLVDLSAMAGEVVAGLRATAPEHPVEVRIQDGLVARADPELTRILLLQLLDNAWKFTRDVPRPLVEFGALARAPDDPAFFVRDNGVGFDAAYAGRIFTAFQRLHDADDYPGSGIGLAIVQRIVNKHGGRAWAESVVGQGATFWFTLSPGGHPS